MFDMGHEFVDPLFGLAPLVRRELRVHAAVNAVEMANLGQPVRLSEGVEEALQELEVGSVEGGQCSFFASAQQMLVEYIS